MVERRCRIWGGLGFGAPLAARFGGMGNLGAALPDYIVLQYLQNTLIVSYAGCCTVQVCGADW